MDYEKKYKEIVGKIRKAYLYAITDSTKAVLEEIFPELNYSESEKIRQRIIRALRGDVLDIEETNKAIAWLEKQCNEVIDCPQNYQDINYPNGCIVLEDFNGGEGHYKLHLDYLNKKQVEEVEEMVKTWNERTKTFGNENIKACVEMCLTDANEQRFKDYETTLKDCLAWLEKQGEQKPIISGDALREGIAHFGITQYQIDNWLKKYVDVDKEKIIK